MMICTKNLSLLLALLLLLFVGCSNSDGSETNTLTQTEESVGKLDNLVVYEVNPLAFGSSKALNAVQQRLDHISALGVNVLWLMPIYEQGQLKAVGSPYCVRDYKALNPVMGTTDDLTSLVSAAHAKGMKVVLDWVANHTSWDNAWIDNKGWYTQNANGEIQSPAGFNWTDVADLNYDNSDMQSEMIACMKYWINTAGVDGFRCDYAEGVPAAFWTRAISELKTIKGEDLVMLAETGDAAYLNYGFDMVYSWDFAYKLQNVFAGKATLSDLYTVYKNEENVMPAGTRRLRYITNHDMSSETALTSAYKSKEGTMAAYAIAVSLNGVPLIYSSQEVAYNRNLSFFGYVPMDWNSNTDIQTAYQQLMSVYTASSALKSGTTKLYANSEKVAMILRETASQKVLVFSNVTADQLMVKVPIEQSGKTVKNLLTGTTATLGNSIELAGYGYQILEIQP